MVTYSKPINSRMTKRFAEFIGILIGDGHLEYRKRGSYFKITGNPKTEIDYYEHVARLASEILKRKIKPRIMDTGRSIGISFGSKRLGEFLFRLGFPKKNKCHTVKIPKKILTKRNLSIACLKGIFDTDGCLTIKRRYREDPYYPTVNITLANKPLIIQISKILDRLRMEHCRVLDKCYYDERTKKFYTKSFIYLYGFTRVHKWFKVIGSGNPATILRYKDKVKEHYSGERLIQFNKRKK